MLDLAKKLLELVGNVSLDFVDFAELLAVQRMGIYLCVLVTDYDEIV